MESTYSDSTHKPKFIKSTKSPNNIQNNVRLFKDFISKHYITSDKSQPITNTRIGDRENGISGGSYHIDVNVYDEFLKLYYNAIILDGKPEYLTEKQLDKTGPFLIDIDIHHDYNVCERIITTNHIDDLIIIYLDVLKNMYQFDENTNFPIFIMQKPSINRVKTKNITKDGLHIIIGIQADRNVQLMTRQKVIDQIKDKWNDIPLVNSWDAVFDDGITAGTTNWQLYGSIKPNHISYELIRNLQVKYDPTDGEFMIIDEDIVKPMPFELFKQLSARYEGHPSIFLTNAFAVEYQKFTSTSGGGPQRKSISRALMPTFHNKPFNSDFPTMTEICAVKNADELDHIVKRALDIFDSTEYDLVEVFKYTMILPNTYYENGSFTKWIRVGWALRNTDDRLFFAWVALSAKSQSFNYSSIRDDLYVRWTTFTCDITAGLSKRSVMFWAKNESPNEYKTIKESSISYYLDQTLEYNLQSIISDEGSKPTGCGDYDIAKLLYQLYKDEFKCVSVKSNIWYQYKNHRWVRNDSGVTLRQSISEELRIIYCEKYREINRKRATIGENEENLKKNLTMKSKIIEKTITKLGQTSDIKNIMTAAVTHFYDGEFTKNLDENPYLLCFNNGVYDFKDMVFRSGKPEDYITKSTNIDYIPLDEKRDKIIMDQINEFMHKLFPNPQLYTYMWDHMASTLIGVAHVQTFNNYIGIGQNGKSVFVNLMELILGEYAHEVPVTLITRQRKDAGGALPEMVALKGIRYAFISEPEKTDKINSGIMKTLTGGNDKCSARGLYQEELTSFRSQFKLVVCLNELMKIDDTTHGAWRRIRVVAFEALFTENPVSTDPDRPYQFKIDPNITEKFEIWKPVLMAMLVKRACETQGKVPDCDKVMKASKEYEKSQDYLAEFIDEYVVRDPNGRIQKTEINNEFKIWWATNGNGKINPKELHAKMDKMFGKNKDKKSGWTGVRIAYDDGENTFDNEDDDNVDPNDIDFNNL